MSALPSMSPRMLRVESSMPVQAPQNPPSISTKSADLAPLATVDVEWLIGTSLARCGLAHTEACEWMALDPSQWAKQIKSRDNAHVSLQRLLKMPRAFWLELLQQLAGPLDVVIAHPDIADRALNQILLAAEAAVTYALQDRALRERRVR